MTSKQHWLEIYDLEDDSGPNPLVLTGLFVVHGPEGSQYYVLKPESAIQYGDQTVQCLAVRPHYDGDPINNVVEGTCTVGIALPSNGADYCEGGQYGFTDFIFWKVGKISPAH